MQLSENGFPRRNRIDLHTPAETAIREAIIAVEEAGCHPLLTDAVVLLGQAKDKVADFVELAPTMDVTLKMTFEEAKKLEADLQTLTYGPQRDLYERLSAGVKRHLEVAKIKEPTNPAEIMRDKQIERGTR